MNNGNVAAVRNAYAVAERKDLEGWIKLFTPVQLPFGELPATGKQMDAPCCDVFELENGKIKRFDRYPEGSIILAQLGVLNNLDAALRH